MVAGRAGVMLVLAVAAQRLLVVALAAEAIDAFAGEEHNKENGDNDKRHTGCGFLSQTTKNLRQKPFAGSRSDYSTFTGEKKACNSISFADLFCAGGQFPQS